MLFFVNLEDKKMNRIVYRNERVNEFHGYSPEDLGFFLSSHAFGGEDYFHKLGVCDGYFGIGDVTWWVGPVLNKLTDEDYNHLLEILSRNIRLKALRDEMVPKMAKILDIEPVYLYRTNNQILLEMFSLNDDELKKFYDDLKSTKWSVDVGLWKIVGTIKEDVILTPEENCAGALNLLDSIDNSEEYELYLTLKKKYEGY